MFGSACTAAARGTAPGPEPLLYTVTSMAAGTRRSHASDSSWRATTKSMDEMVMAQDIEPCSTGTASGSRPRFLPSS
jgi:hypothetical protein